MPRRPSRSRRLATAARWPLGIALTSWRYMWRTTPLRRRELPGSPRSDAPPSLPGGVDLADVQPAEDGAGPFFHRRYRIRIRDAPMGAEALMTELRADLNHAAPTEFARFEKVLGEEGEVRVGDEFVVRMAGPWDGPVRVVEAGPASLRLATLRGHLEAGQVEFRAEPEGDLLVFTIESWARSGDRLSDLLYQHLRLAKEVQLHMWTSFLERVTEVAGGRRSGALEVETRRVEGPVLTDARRLSPGKARALEALARRGLNFDPSRREVLDERHGWQVDHRRCALPAEPPGEPAPDGSWARARAVLRDYEFADSALVRATYRPDTPLMGRDMLLELRFSGLRFRAGVRVDAVYDETRDIGGRAARVYGWRYRTLEGHLEMGEMEWEVWKWLETGEVEFQLHAISRRVPTRNAFVRAALRLFGRREQLRFYERCCARVAQLVTAPSAAAAITSGPA
jgi:uncharacterized protein (UPF0548 family)